MRETQASRAVPARQCAARGMGGATGHL